MLTLPVGRVDVPNTAQQKKKTKPTAPTKIVKNEYLLQFRMDGSRRKVVWKRLLPMPESMKEYQWIYYDDLRDVLIGYKFNDNDPKCYKLGYLPDMGKLLAVSEKTPQGNRKRTKEEKEEVQRKSQIISNALIQKLKTMEDDSADDEEDTATATATAKSNNSKNKTKDTSKTKVDHAPPIKNKSKDLSNKTSTPKKK
ncbi:hypothetical protein RFI_21487 [Reticulomyxa filosa]|uniref:Uncharacterized protein n=1 Tax=Reticulomyxa filosa TaxID=46433 RepID=X6MR39_RETFI|nr:hypothetical protein RFI_21487 [Reticulomyxa filosa]|eukprot:ETO15877.1 hypothetical protein RFI_21487 [Reticulomyxa filosa]